MKYLPSVVVLCILSYSCTSALEVDLQPTPLAFQPFVMMYDHQPRASCAVACDKIAASLAAANSAAASAQDVASAVSAESSLAAAACAINSVTTVSVSIPGLGCPSVPLGRSAISGSPTHIAATSAALRLSEMTAAADPSFQ